MGELSSGLDDAAAEVEAAAVAMAEELSVEEGKEIDSVVVKDVRVEVATSVTLVSSTVSEVVVKMWRVVTGVEGPAGMGSIVFVPVELETPSEVMVSVAVAGVEVTVWVTVLEVVVKMVVCSEVVDRLVSIGPMVEVMV